MKKIQEVTDYKVMSIKECLDALGWSYTNNENSYNDISCHCGGKLEFSGFVGTEVVRCLNCGKHMIDLFSPIPVSNSTCSFLNPEDYEMDEGRHWIAIDNENGIKV